MILINSEDCLRCSWVWVVRLLLVVLEACSVPSDPQGNLSFLRELLSVDKNLSPMLGTLHRFPLLTFERRNVNEPSTWLSRLPY